MGGLQIGQGQLGVDRTLLNRLEDCRRVRDSQVVVVDVLAQRGDRLSAKLARPLLTIRQIEIRCELHDVQRLLRRARLVVEREDLGLAAGTGNETIVVEARGDGEPFAPTFEIERKLARSDDLGSDQR